MIRYYGVLLILCNCFCILAGSSLPKLAWLHAPKTGSTFCMTIQHVYDKENFEKYIQNRTAEGKNIQVNTFQGCISVSTKYSVSHQWHIPFDNDHTKKWVGFVREPKSRLISAFFDHKHHEGIHDGDFKAAMAPYQKSNEIEQFAAYVNSFDMRGCQVCIFLMLVLISPLSAYLNVDKNAFGV